MKFLRSLFIFIIRSYQVLLSPILSARCRFQPTCSAYAIEAFKTLPLHVAAMKSTVRVCKCHPFHPGGYDPVDKKLE